MIAKQFKDYIFSKHSLAFKIANDFDYILNNIWCIYSFDKGKKKWREIASEIPEPYRQNIFIEICHVELGHGIDQARMAVKSEMEKCLDYLIGKEIYNIG